MTEESTSSEFIVEATRELDAPPAVAWRSWTDPAMLQRWWGPTGFTCPTADLDVRVGGTSLVSMSAPELGFPEMFSSWEYTAVDEPDRLEFVFRFTDEHGAPLPETARPPGRSGRGGAHDHLRGSARRADAHARPRGGLFERRTPGDVTAGLGAVARQAHSAVLRRSRRSLGLARREGSAHAVEDRVPQGGVRHDRHHEQNSADEGEDDARDQRNPPRHASARESSARRGTAVSIQPIASTSAAAIPHGRPAAGSASSPSTPSRLEHRARRTRRSRSCSGCRSRRSRARRPAARTSPRGRRSVRAASFRLRAPPQRAWWPATGESAGTAPCSASGSCPVSSSRVRSGCWMRARCSSGVAYSPYCGRGVRVCGSGRSCAGPSAESAVVAPARGILSQFLREREQQVLLGGRTSSTSR